MPLLRREYDRLVELGMFDDARVELLEGALVEVSPEGPAHSWVITELADHLTRQIAPDLIVGAGNPWAAGDSSEPEPDLAVVPRRRYETEHPHEAVLLVEVARTSLSKDLATKARLYAAAGAATYWVIDLTCDLVHVHTQPSSAGYRSVLTIGFDQPVSAAGVRVVLQELLHA